MQNNPNHKKILVCEFITGGGLCAEPLPPSLAKEGALMRDALLRDLSDCMTTDNAHFSLIGMHDARLTPSSLFAESHPVAGELQSFEQLFEELLKTVDFVWLIAPETDGTLLRLCELCYAEENTRDDTFLIGCGYDSVLIGTSKSLTFNTLQDAHIYTLPIYAGDELLDVAYVKELIQSHPHVKQWVAKVEDGAGCEGMRLFDDLLVLRDWLIAEDLTMNYFAQPYQKGIAASFCMLCVGGKAWLLSANQQHVAIVDDGFKLNGVTLNGAKQYWLRFETIARKLAKALPDALGYVGVDVIIDTEQDKVLVIDINPRLSTSYVGLRDAVSINPAQLILDCVLSDDFKMPTITKHKIDVLI